MNWLKGSILAAAVIMAVAGTLAAAAPQATSPAAATFRLGAMQVTSLRDADNVLDNDGKVFGVDVGPSAVAAVLSRGGASTTKVTLSVDGLLVRTVDRTMLFDTGLGPAANGALMSSLRSAGVDPNNVTDVFITHSHGDHVGGLVTADSALAFPSATIHLSSQEWTWMQGQRQSKALVDVIRPKVQPFEPGSAVAPSVKSIRLFGHTPGHVGYEIGAGPNRIIDVGDLVHSSILSLARPDWRVGYDDDGVEAAAIRRATLQKLAASHVLIFAPHFPFPGIGQIVVQTDGYSFSPRPQ